MKVKVNECGGRRRGKEEGGRREGEGALRSKNFWVAKRVVMAGQARVKFWRGKTTTPPSGNRDYKNYKIQ